MVFCTSKIYNISIILYFIIFTCIILSIFQSAHIVHRDIKPENILIDDNQRVSLIDYGLSRQISSDYFGDSLPRVASIPNPHLGVQARTDLTPLVVSRNYRAPELSIRQGYYNGEIDVFSVGCLMYELFETLKPPTPGGRRVRIDPLITSGSDALIEDYKKDLDTRHKLIERPKEHLQHLIKILGKPSEDDIEYIRDEQLKLYFRTLPKIQPLDWNRKLNYLDDEDSTLGVDLMKKCLKFNPNKRITVREALEHPYLAEVRDKNQEIEYRGVSFNFEYEKWRDWKDLTNTQLKEKFLNFIRQELNQCSNV